MNMNVCVIMYFILNCFFFPFLRNFLFIFASELGGLLYLYLKLLCFLCILNRIEENINYLEWGKKKKQGYQSFVKLGMNLDSSSKWWTKKEKKSMEKRE